VSGCKREATAVPLVAFSKLTPSRKIMFSSKSASTGLVQVHVIVVFVAFLNCKLVMDPGGVVSGALLQGTTVSLAAF